MRLSATAVLVLSAAAPCLAQQESLLKNDRFAADISTVSDAQLSVQAGFVADEIAAAILPIPSTVAQPIKVLRVQIMWASTQNGTVPPSTQGSVMIYRNSVLASGSQLIFDSAEDAAGGDGFLPQLQDGGLNEFDFSTENISIPAGAAAITVGLKFSTPTNQQTGPSVCSDRPPGNPQFCTPGRNAIYGTSPDFQVATPQWFEPRKNVEIIPGFTTLVAISGNFFIRAVVQPAQCPADMGATGGVPGPDGELNNNDFIVFVDYFFAQNILADIGRTGGQPGPDGEYNNNDFIVFIDQFFAGC